MLNNLLTKIKLFKAQRQALFELNRMSDKELADIGISRSMIPYVVKGMQ